jgi:hypothetical protein
VIVFVLVVLEKRFRSVAARNIAADSEQLSEKF